MSEELEFTRNELLDIDRRAGLRHGVNQSGELEFAELIAKDQHWASLVDGVTPSAEEMDNAALYERYSQRLEDPETPLLLLGGLYLQSDNEREGWVSVSRSINKMLGGFTGRPPEDLVGKLINILDSMKDEGLLQRANSMYRIHPGYKPEHDFWQGAEDFEGIVTSYLSRRPLGAVGAFCVYNYFTSVDPGLDYTEITASQYWGGRYELQRLSLRGTIEKVPNDRGFVRLPKNPYDSLGTVQDDLNQRINNSRYRAAESLESKLEAAGVKNSALRKPRQRDRWKKG